jgi:hypothetical protein
VGGETLYLTKKRSEINGHEVPSQFPLLILVKVGRREGNTFGSEKRRDKK